MMIIPTAANYLARVTREILRAKRDGQTPTVEVGNLRDRAEMVVRPYAALQVEKVNEPSSTTFTR